MRTDMAAAERAHESASAEPTRLPEHAHPAPFASAVPVRGLAYGVVRRTLKIDGKQYDGATAWTTFFSTPRKRDWITTMTGRPEKWVKQQLEDYAADTKRNLVLASVDELTRQLMQDATAAMDPKSPQNMLTVPHWDKQAKKEGGLPYPDIRSGTRSDRPGGVARDLNEITTTVVPALTQELATAAAAAPKNAPRMKIYRTMPRDQAIGLLAWLKAKGNAGPKIEYPPDADELGLNGQPLPAANPNAPMPVSGHLGDAVQALGYRSWSDTDAAPGTTANVTVEFTLKPEAHKVLFTSKYAAVGTTGVGAGMVAEGGIKSGQTFPKTRGTTGSGEGKLGGYIGIKSEQIDGVKTTDAKSPAFSLGLGDNAASQRLFQEFVAKVKFIE